MGLQNTHLLCHSHALTPGAILRLSHTVSHTSRRLLPLHDIQNVLYFLFHFSSKVASCSVVEHFLAKQKAFGLILTWSENFYCLFYMYLSRFLTHRQQFFCPHLMMPIPMPTPEFQFKLLFKIPKFQVIIINEKVLSYTTNYLVAINDLTSQ